MPSKGVNVHRANSLGLGPYAFAYLAGGAGAAVDEAIVSLVREGRLAFDDAGQLVPGALVREPMLAHAYRSVWGDQHPLESAILTMVAEAPHSLAAVRRSARASARALWGDVLRQRLARTPFGNTLGLAVRTSWLDLGLWAAVAVSILQESRGGPAGACSFVFAWLLLGFAGSLYNNRAFPRERALPTSVVGQAES